MQVKEIKLHSKSSNSLVLSIAPSPLNPLGHDLSHSAGTTNTTTATVTHDYYHCYLTAVSYSVDGYTIRSSYLFMVARNGNS